jgi:hypothetical protein
MENVTGIQVAICWIFTEDVLVRKGGKGRIIGIITAVTSTSNLVM